MYRLEISTSGPEQVGSANSLGDGNFCIGSAAAADIVVPGLDPIHARLELDGGKAWISPGQEHSKLLINGQPVRERVEAGLPVRLQLGSFVLASLGYGAGERKAALPVVGSTTIVMGGGAEVGDQTMRILLSPAAAHEEEMSITNRHRRVLPEVVLDGEEEVMRTVFFDMKPLVTEVDRMAPIQMEYALKEEIARGGMGRIFAAADPLLGREVAVKVSTVQSEGGEAQFAHEAKVLAELAHPNIVPVHAMGVNPQGLPFYSMKLVRGKTLQAIIKELAAKNPDTTARYRLERLLMIFRKVCDAVAFAHSKGFLHRDLKPENVMVGEFGEVLVMDWGLAQPFKRNIWGAVLEGAASEGAEICIEGTPQYMSPEQAQALPLDERSDVYSLGAVLYAILALRAPVQGRTLEEVLQRVRGGDVAPMSTRLVGSKSEQEPHPEFVADIRRGIPEALRAVTFKAMERDPEDRYQNVSELVADVEAYLNGFATEAENANWMRQFFLWMRRHPGVSVLFLLLILSAGVFTVRLSASEHKALMSAEEARSNAQKANENAEQARKNAREAELNSRKAREERDRGRQESARTQIALAEAAERDLNAEAMNRVLQAVPEDLRTQEWEFLKSKANSEWRTYRTKDGGPWRAVTPHPVEAGIVLCVENDGSCVRLDLNSGESREAAAPFPEPSKLRFHNYRLPVSPDGTRFAFCRDLSATASPSGLYDYQIEIYSFNEPREALVIKRQRSGRLSPLELQFDRSGDFLLAIPVNDSKDGVFMIDARTGACLWERYGDGRCTANFSGASSNVLLYSELNGILSLPAAGMPVAVQKAAVAPQEAKRPKIPQPYADFRRVAFTNQFNVILAFQSDILRKIDLQAGRNLFSQKMLSGSDGKIAHLSGEETFLAILPRTERSGVLNELDIKDGSLVCSTLMELDYQNSDRSTLSVFKHPVSREVGVLRWNQLKVWKPLPNLFAVSKLQDSVLGFAFQPGVLVQASGFSPGTPFRFGLLDHHSKDGRTLHEMTIDDTSGEFAELKGEVSADGRKIRFLCRGKSGGRHHRFFKISDDMRIEEETGMSSSAGYIFSPSGKLASNVDKVFDTVSGRKISSLDMTGILNRTHLPIWVGEERVVEICQVLEGDASTPADSARAMVLWSVKDARKLAQKIAPDASALCSSPDGSLIAEAGGDMKVRIRNGLTLEEEKQFRLHDGPITALAWNPKRPVLATLSSDNTVKIFDVRTEKVLETLAHRLGGGARLVWSPDGLTLMVSSKEGQSYLYVPRLEPQ